MKDLIIATTPLQAKIAQHIKGLYPDQDFVGLYVSPVKNARQEHYAKGFDHVPILRRQRTWLRFVRNWPETMTPSFMLVLTIA